jgi:hypothetical protein
MQNKNLEEHLFGTKAATPGGTHAIADTTASILLNKHIKIDLHNVKRKKARCRAQRE